VLFVEPGASRASYDQQVQAAVAASPKAMELFRLDVFSDSTRSTGVSMSSETEFREAYVDPYSGQALGYLGDDGFFRIVLKIHRQLFLGTTGRIVVELTTCWTIVLLFTGVYLWWPRKASQRWGVWVPRLRGSAYRTLRDLHAVTGFYIALVVLTIACTGLLYTFFWGQGYGYVARETGAYDIFLKPPQSKSPASAPRLPLDQIVKTARKKMPDMNLSITFPKTPQGAFVVFAFRERGPSTSAVAVIDHASGEILQYRTNSQFPAMSWWGTWNYPLHVGSILGLPTKIIWFLACLALMAMPITGCWMWWQRRPTGQLGLPRVSEAVVPRWITAIICLLGVLLPALGASIVLILLAEFGTRRFWRRAAT